MADEERPPKRPATYQDVIDAPEHMVAEILDGELFLSPRPALGHTIAAGRLFSIISPAFDEGFGGPGGWRILTEPELHIGTDVVVPDLAGWKRERFPRVPRTAAFLSVAPDWACELLSPSTEKIDRARTLRIYAREGVGHVWLINPLLRMLEVRRRVGNGWSIVGTHQDDEIVRADPFETIELRLTRVWDDLEPLPNGQTQE